MKLTPLAKGFIAATVVGVVGFVVYKNVGDKAKEWSGANPSASASASSQPAGVSKEDFSALGDSKDHDRKSANPNVAAASIGTAVLNRPLRVAINTWAGHAPGIVANGGLEPNKAGSIYLEKYKLAVEFSLIEDPAAKLSAFSSGKIDVMWDTVDSWGREASTLAEQNIKAKAIIQQDWSRGGDGIVSTKNIKSIEDLKGKKIATTQYTPSHWLLLYMVHQSGLTAAEKRELEANLVFTQDAPSAAAAFRSKKVDAAVTWEPDLSGAVKAREAEAHVLVSTTAATNVIADTLVARQDVIDQAPATLRDFVHGWFDGIDAMGKDPNGTNEVVAKALKLTGDDVSGMLSGLKLTHFADNALFFGLSGTKPQANSLFDTAFVVWRKQGAINKVVDAKDNFDSRFVAALGNLYAGQKVEDTFKADAKTKAKERAIVNKRIAIHFAPGSDKIMPGSEFTLDALGDTMTAFGSTILSIEGHTDNTGDPALNRELSQKRAESVKKYLVQNFSIPEKRVRTAGFGQDKPVAPNTNEDGRMQNRRTEIHVILNAE